MNEATAAAIRALNDIHSLPHEKAARIAELEKALGALADALQDEIESSMGRELTARDLPREWHAAQKLLGRQ